MDAAGEIVLRRGQVRRLEVGAERRRVAAVGGWGGEAEGEGGGCGGERECPAARTVAAVGGWSGEAGGEGGGGSAGGWRRLAEVVPPLPRGNHGR